MLQWRIYYDTGAVRDDTQGPLQPDEKLGVQVIQYPDPVVGRVVLSMRDYYWLADYGWDGGDLFGLFDYLIQSSAPVVLFGRGIRTPRYREILKKALADTDFPAKSGWYDWEDRVNAR